MVWELLLHILFSWRRLPIFRRLRLFLRSRNAFLVLVWVLPFLQSPWIPGPPPRPQHLAQAAGPGAALAAAVSPLAAPHGLALPLYGMAEPHGGFPGSPSLAAGWQPLHDGSQLGLN